MELYKKIKKLKGWKDYAMAKALGITQTQLKHYEKNPISTREVNLVKLQQLSGLSAAEFWDLLEREARAEDERRKRRKIEEIKDS